MFNQANNHGRFKVRGDEPFLAKNMARGTIQMLNSFESLLALFHVPDVTRWQEWPFNLVRAFVAGFNKPRRNSERYAFGRLLFLTLNMTPENAAWFTAHWFDDDRKIWRLDDRPKVRRHVAQMIATFHSRTWASDQTGYYDSVDRAWVFTRGANSK